MLRWDVKYLKKLKQLGIVPTLYVRYVDDTLVLLEVIMPGVRYNPRTGKLQHHPELEDADTLIADDVRTFKVLNSIADSLDKDIQWEFDVPSQHPNNKLPCLDLEVWIQEQDQEIGDIDKD